LGEESNIINQARELLKALDEYRKKIKPDSADTEVTVKDVNFSVDKKDEEYALNVEVDLSLTPKDRRGKDKKSKE
jgi:hypothetical protein